MSEHIEEAYKIWRKGDYFTQMTKDGVCRIEMDPSVVKLPEGKIPLHYGFETKVPLGNVDNVRLEDGEILGDYNWVKEDSKNEFEALVGYDDGYRIGGHYGDVEFSKDGSRVESCRLISASYVFNPANPKVMEKR